MCIPHSRRKFHVQTDSSVHLHLGGRRGVCMTCHAHTARCFSLETWFSFRYAYSQMSLSAAISLSRACTTCARMVQLRKSYRMECMQVARYAACAQYARSQCEIIQGPTGMRGVQQVHFHVLCGAPAAQLFRSSDTNI